MRSSSFLLLLFLPFCLSASQDPRQKQLVDLAAAGNGVIQLDEAKYDLLTAAKRNWSFAVHFTALDPRRKCNQCREFDPSWNAVGRAWATAPEEHRNNHFFATLDFDNGHGVFQRLGLTSAPVVYIFHATEGPRRPANGKYGPLKFDFSSGFDPEPLAEQMSAYTPIQIPYKAPIDWTFWGSIASSVVLFLLAIPFILPALQSRWIWAAVTILTSLIMISGFMYTRIRGVPYVGSDGNWIAGGFQHQFGQEVPVIAAIYGLLSAAFLMLIVIIPRQRSPMRQKVQVYLWTAIVMIMYSVLVSIFRIKNRGYPFKLLV